MGFRTSRHHDLQLDDRYLEFQADLAFYTLTVHAFRLLIYYTTTQSALDAQPMGHVRAPHLPAYVYAALARMCILYLVC